MTRLFDHLDSSADSAIQITTLLENHRAVLRYLERRVGDSSLAEDILQDAFCQSGRATGASADRRSVDQFRRRGAADRAFKAFARELEARITHGVRGSERQATAPWASVGVPASISHER